MTTISVTERGQVTFRKDILRHLGVGPGDKLHLDLLPDGRAELRAEKPAGSFGALRGALAGKISGPALTIEEIGEAIAQAGAEAGARRR